MQDMPTGVFVRRKSEDNFKAKQAQKYGIMATEWLDWKARSDGVNIIHKFNGTEKRVGTRNIPVDAFSPENNTVYQFHGCYWHGHNCHLNQKDFNEVRNCSSAELRANTEEIASYICRRGYNLVQIWECEWQSEQSANVLIRDFFNTIRLLHHQKKTMTQREVLNFIKDGSLFGLVECDIRVPNTLLQDFEEMPPIFKNIEISRNYIGDHMKAYAEKEGLMNKPRRSLIGSMFGRRILLATPLLRWYLSHGLEVQNVYEVIQYGENNCFMGFGEAVS